MKKKKKHTDELPKLEDLLNFYEELRTNPTFFRMAGIKQHRNSNTYRHVCMVTEASLVYAYKRKLNIDYYSLIRGAYLHDLFLYDWRKESRKTKLKHLFKHPQIAYQNACKYFQLTETEKDIILHHMFPVTLIPPRTKEGWIVSKKDKQVTFKEVWMKKRKKLFFDLDGTLIDTVQDLNNAVNYALSYFNYPTRSLEQTQADIGNGVSKLIERSIPNGVNNDNYPECLAKFKEYYSHHYLDQSKPYDDVNKVLIKLKEKGYRLAVVTNKYQKHAEDMVNKFFPNMFEAVIGLEEDVNPKPNSEMIIKAEKKMKIKNPYHVLYIGDTEVDLETAKNARVGCVLVTYGYRKRGFLINLKGDTPLMDSPKQLLTYLTGEILPKEKNKIEKLNTNL